MSGAYTQTMNGNADAEAAPATKPAPRRLQRAEWVALFAAGTLTVWPPLMIRYRLLEHPSDMSDAVHLLLVAGLGAVFFGLYLVWHRYWRRREAAD